MSMTPWHHKSETKSIQRAAEQAISRLREDLEQFIDKVAHSPWWSHPLESLPARLGWGPRVDVVESATQYTVRVDLPGVNSEDIDLSVSGNVMTVRAERRRDAHETADDYRYCERRYGSLQRSIPLPGAVDPGQISAEFKQGVLTITMGKTPRCSTHLFARSWRVGRVVG